MTAVLCDRITCECFACGRREQPMWSIQRRGREVEAAMECDHCGVVTTWADLNAAAAGELKFIWCDL